MYKINLILLLAFGLFTKLPAFGQTVTLGSGTDLNGITTASPINIWFRKTVCQMVYTEAELTAGGAIAGPINQLGFFISNNPIYALPDYEISIKHTMAADASGDLEGGYTVVKTIGSYAPAAGGWDMLELDTPFDWDGVQNIVVRVCWSQVSPTFDPSGQLRVYTATDGFKYARNDAGGSMCANVPTTTLDTKPQIRFVFQSDSQWTGVVSSNWFNPANWSANVPSETMDAGIPPGTPNNPLLNSLGTCKSLTLNGTLTLGANGQLDIYGDFINTGTYNDLGGITRFTGVAPHVLSTVPDITISNLQANSSAGLDITSGNVIIGEELQINKGLFNTGDAVTMRSDASGTARIDELSTTCTYTLNMTDTWGDGWNGGFLAVFEDGVEVGTFSAIGAASSASFQIVSGADFTLEYTPGSFEVENAYTLTDEGDVELFSDGPTPSTGEVYSDVASGCTYSSTITGDITMQRYINEGETFWRYFASAVENPTIAQYLDDFTTAGFPGSPFPDFPFNSIYSYDETLPPGEGYVPCLGTDEVIEVGQGYQVWSGDIITGTEPFFVDLSGPPNQGDIVLPVTYTPSGTPTEDGWCLIGNPYASTIDWDSPNWTKTNMADATYIQDPDSQNYATYISGAGANGGSRYIASQQSFWVQAIAAAPLLEATEGVKSNVDATFFKAGEIYNQGMTIQINGGPVTDQAVLRHIEGASDEMETQFDALKVFGGWGVNPQITVVNDAAQDLTIQSIDKGFEEWEIALRTIVFETGIYELEFMNVFELDVPCLKLEDTYTGVFYDIEAETILPFEMYDTTYAPRFIIHLGRDYESEKVHNLCYDLEEGQIELDLDFPADISYELHLGDSWDNHTGFGDPLLITDLNAGLYTVIIEDLGDLCETDTFHFSIHEPSQITLDASITDETFGNDGAIVVSVDGGTEPYSYLWSTGAVVNSIYDLSSGTYSVVITDANSCGLDSNFTINSLVDLVEVNEELERIITYNQLDKTIKIFGENLDNDGPLYLFTINGQLIQVNTVFGDDKSRIIELPKHLSHGNYLLKPTNANWVYRFSY